MSRNFNCTKIFSMFNRNLDKKLRKISTEEINKLMSYHWPGNVRELKHFIEKAVILSNGYDISFAGLEFDPAAQISREAGKIAPLADMERDHIEKALKSTLWKISGPFGAATLLAASCLPPCVIE